MKVEYFTLDSDVRRNRYRLYNFCKNENIPLITFEKKRKYYHLHVDMFCTNYDINNDGITLLNKMMTEEIDYIESKKVPRYSIWYGAGGTGLDFPMVFKERIKYLGDKIVEIIQKHSKLVCLEQNECLEDLK